jgi:hypothetical protein
MYQIVQINSSEKFFYYLDDQCHYKTKNDHGSNRKIKSEIFFFNPDISGQSPDPMQLIMKKINDHSDCNNEYANNDDPFPCFTVHTAKLMMNRNTCIENY